MHFPENATAEECAELVKSHNRSHGWASAPYMVTVPGCQVCEQPTHGRRTVRTGRMFGGPGAEEPDSEEVCDGHRLFSRDLGDDGAPEPIEPPEESF